MVSLRASGHDSLDAGWRAAPITPSRRNCSRRAADTLLTDVRALDPSIVVELRYATANNFTGAPYRVISPIAR